MNQKQQNRRETNHLTDPRFQGKNKIFVLLFNHNADRTKHARYYLPTIKIKDYNVKIDAQNFPDQPVKNDLKT